MATINWKTKEEQEAEDQKAKLDPTPEERIAALEDALLMLMMEG